MIYAAVLCCAIYGDQIFNLDVADDADFFVGETGVLAHDNTLPSLHEVPFDLPELKSTAVAH